MSSNPVGPLPQGKLHTPKPKQNRVIARHLNGESKRKIAREEQIDRATVDRIVSQEEVVTMVASAQSRLLRMVPQALDVIEEELTSEYPGTAVAIATKILEGTGVMNRRGLKGTIDDSKARHFDTSTKSISDFVVGPGEFVWPSGSVPPQPERKRQHKKLPRPEPIEISTNESASDSDDHG